MELQECLLTEKELELLSVAELVFSKTNYLSYLSLTGNLALAIQGFKIPREADNIEFCDYGVDPWDIMDEFCTAKLIEESGKDIEKYYKLELDGHIISFAELNLGSIEDEYITVNHNGFEFKILKAQYILEYKMRHSFDTDHGHPQKHKQDLIYILTNN